MRREILKTSKQDNAFNRIMGFMTEEDGITLTSDEEFILHRWTFAYKTWLQRKHKESEIIQKITDTFGVSSFTARNDIYRAQALFGGSLRTNKRFLLHHHAENILLYIEKCKLDKSLSYLVPKLMDSYTKCVKEIPTEEDKEKLHPPVLNFWLVADQSVPVEKSFEDAIANMKQRQNIVDIEHEEVNDAKE